MTEDWQRINRVYHEALAHDAESRPAYLDKACGNDEDLRREVQQLLECNAEADAKAFLEQPGVASSDLILLSPGMRLQHYEIIALIGAGGSGEVYRARDTKLGREVAIKVLPDVSIADPERRVQIEREARMLAALNHPNIAAIYELEESDGVLWLVLELVEGDTLEERIRRAFQSERTGLPLPDALTIARQIAEALAAAHAKGIFHRDVKPANIKITPTGKVKLLDFGLASIDGTATGDGELVAGTPAYMSPEQARGESVDKRTDIWAFGCVLYEALSGKRPFAGETLSETITNVLEREPEWDGLPVTTPLKIRDALSQCLQKNPARRMRDIADAQVVIEDVLNAGRNGHITPRAPKVAGAISAIVLLVLSVSVWLSVSRQTPADRSQWMQLTKFPDSATQPALSPDGRTLAFIRGPGTFTTNGQIYIKRLPDGEPIPLTRDNSIKMSPVFSPDGARIAYTVREGNWNTWVVSPFGGNPRLWLRNASGLTWMHPNEILFSEVMTGGHMGIVASPENAIEGRELYFPAQGTGMAHRSYASPDGKWVAIVEMTGSGAWLPCRLLSLSDNSSERLIGPRGGHCTSAAWSPDAKWIYVTANGGDGFHIWRQRPTANQPEQVTSDPLTEEEGLVVAPDGRSIITSSGVHQISVWLHDDSGDRQISVEGNASSPRFSGDGKKLYYTVTKGKDISSPIELWVADLDSGHSAQLIPDLAVTCFSLSRDDRMVAGVREADGKTRLWLTSLDGHSAPRQISAAEADMPVFGSDGEIFFAAEGDATSKSLFRIREDGSGQQKISSNNLSGLQTASPDGKWVGVSIWKEGKDQLSAYPTSGGAPVPIYADVSRIAWSADGNRMYVSVPAGSNSFGDGRTYVFPLPRGSMIPSLPRGGYRTEAEMAAVPSVEIVPYGDVAPGPSPGAYAFSRVTTTRNLYRIPLH